jgi:hypothetical protein
LGTDGKDGGGDGGEEREQDYKEEVCGFLGGGPCQGVGGVGFAVPGLEKTVRDAKDADYVVFFGDVRLLLKGCGRLLGEALR